MQCRERFGGLRRYYHHMAASSVEYRGEAYETAGLYLFAGMNALFAAGKIFG